MSDRKIRSAANKAKNVREFASLLGYKSSHFGSNTMRKVVRVVGYDVYDEIASGDRSKTPRSRWYKLPVNNR